MRLVFLSLLLGTLSFATDLPVDRILMDADGRTLTATILRVDEDEISIRRVTDGATFTIPRTQLSEKDQRWLEENFRPEPEELEWPRRAEADRKATQIEVVEETYKDGIFIYRSEHFEYVSEGRLSRSLVRDFAEIFEATYAAVMAMPLPWAKRPPETPMNVRIFATEDSFVRAGGIPNSAGTYRSSTHTCYVPARSLGLVPTSTGFTKEGEADHAILLHEVTHQVTHQWGQPVWLSEAIAEYIEHLPYSDGTVHFGRFDPRDPLRARVSYTDASHLVRPTQLLSMSHSEWLAAFSSGDPHAIWRNYRTAHFLALFFLHLSDAETQEHFYTYLDQAAEHGRLDHPAHLLLKHSSGLDLDERVARAFRSVGLTPEWVD